MKQPDGGIFGYDGGCAVCRAVCDKDVFDLFSGILLLQAIADLFPDTFFFIIGGDDKRYGGKERRRWISCRRLRRGDGGPFVLSQGGEYPGDNGIAGIVVKNDKK